MNKSYNRTELLVSYLRKNSRRKMTIEQICDGFNSMLKSKKFRVNYTPSQIAPYLTRLTTKNVVNKFGGDGINSNGRQVSRWTYNQPTKA